MKRIFGLRIYKSEQIKRLRHFGVSISFFIKYIYAKEAEQVLSDSDESI